MPLGGLLIGVGDLKHMGIGEAQARDLQAHR